MIIALDYDETYDMDFDLWEAFATLAADRGHQVLCVTARHVPPGTYHKFERVPSFPVYCTAGQPKRDFMLGLGIRIDVWIDDRPESIVSYSIQGSLILPNMR